MNKKSIFFSLISFTAISNATNVYLINEYQKPVICKFINPKMPDYTNREFTMNTGTKWLLGNASDITKLEIKTSTSLFSNIIGQITKIKNEQSKDDAWLTILKSNNILQWKFDIKWVPASKDFAAEIRKKNLEKLGAFFRLAKDTAMLYTLIIKNNILGPDIATKLTKICPTSTTNTPLCQAVLNVIKNAQDFIKSKPKDLEPKDFDTFESHLNNIFTAIKNAYDRL